MGTGSDNYLPPDMRKTGLKSASQCASGANFAVGSRRIAQYLPGEHLDGA